MIYIQNLLSLLQFLQLHNFNFFVGLAICKEPKQNKSVMLSFFHPGCAGKEVNHDGS